MIDTHCHLNLKALVDQADMVIKRAQEAGVKQIIVPGTDIISSKKAVELAEKYKEIYAAVGIHPHHAKDISIQYAVSSMEELLKSKKVVAIGEVGMDKYVYKKTKYENYQVDPEFVQAQKTLFIEQIKLGIKYKKSLIIHNWEATGETLEIMGDSSILNPLAGHIVFHCCEANEDLLKFALAHRIYIGVDGDVTYSKTKEEFVKKVPLELLVLETDAPYLLPEPLKSEKKYPNQPKNLPLIAKKISEIKKIPLEKTIGVTKQNSLQLFSL